MEIQGLDGGEATTQSVLKVVTCNLFEINMDDLEEHKSTGGKTGARGRGKGEGGGGERGRVASSSYTVLNDRFVESLHLRR